LRSTRILSNFGNAVNLLYKPPPGFY